MNIQNRGAVSSLPSSFQLSWYFHFKRRRQYFLKSSKIIQIKDTMSSSLWTCPSLAVPFLCCCSYSNTLENNSWHLHAKNDVYWGWTSNQSKYYCWSSRNQWKIHKTDYFKFWAPTSQNWGKKLNKIFKISLITIQYIIFFAINMKCFLFTLCDIFLTS